MEIPTHTISTLSTYIELIEKLSGNSSSQSQLWYRGHSSPAYDLKPTFLRKEGLPEGDELRMIDSRLFDVFCQRAASFIEIRTGYDWSSLFFMQH
jgi:hypothetical protein